MADTVETGRSWVLVRRIQLPYGRSSVRKTCSGCGWEQELFEGSRFIFDISRYCLNCGAYLMGERTIDG